jgi:peptidoglycan/xylan/chitin deacetylase (PgdA/CDA1 family)
MEVRAPFLEELILHLLDEKYLFWSLDELHHNLQKGLPRERFACFTFDDGYSDTYSLAYPILKKHAVPFAVYVSTNFPAKDGTPVGSEVLEHVLESRDRLKFEWAGKRYDFDLRTEFRKLKAFHLLKNILIRLETGQKSVFYSALSASPKDLSAALSKHPAMSWEQIKDLSRDPLVTIGAHTRSHRALAFLSESEMRDEIQGSREALQNRLHVPIEHFSYPYGGAHEAGAREFRVVRELGFKTATTSRIGNILPEHAQALERLPRFPVSGRMENCQSMDALLSGVPSTLLAWRL